MRAGLLTALGSRLGRTVRWFMLIVGILSVPGAGAQALQRPHCARHQATAVHARDGAASSHAHLGGAPTLNPGAGHECPHCPAAECAAVAPCAGSTAPALSPARAAVVGPHDRRLTVELVAEQASSTDLTPNTPPPQPIP